MKTSCLKLGYLAILFIGIFPIFAQNPSENAKLKYTDLTEQEMYLMRFQSICYKISPEENWEQYLTEYDEKHTAPGFLDGKAGSTGNIKQAQERGLLMTNHVPGQVQLAPLAPHFPLQYLYKFYSSEFLKVTPGSSRQAFANEFDIRKNVPEGKKRMVADAAALPFGEERYFRGQPMKRSQYDFENQCFYVQPDFSNVVGFLGMYAGSESVKIPITFIEEYKSFLSKLTIPIPEDKAEILFTKLDQIPNIRLWPKVVFTLIDEPVKEPVYVSYNGYNWWTLYPLKFKIKYIDIELIKGFHMQGSELIHRIEDIPTPQWDGWAISSGQMQMEGAIGPISASLSSLQGKTSGATTTSGAPNVNSSETTATAQRNFPFMRFYKNRVKEPYVQYTGFAKNSPKSLKPFGQIQLELCYAYYFDPKLHLFRLLKPSMIYGGIYLGVNGEPQHLWQAIDNIQDLDDGRTYRLKLGTMPYGKKLRNAGYKNSYCEVRFNDDHSLSFTLYDKNGEVHVTSELLPLNKAEKPPFTNN